MGSINARLVAKEVSETIRNKKKVVLGKIIRKRYSKSTSESPTIVTNTKSYKEAIEPVISALEIERTEILKRMKKTRSKAKYRDLTYSLDIVTKNHQLLTGGKTENLGIEGLSNELNKLIDNVKNANA